MSEEIDRIRNYGKRYIPQKSGMGYFAQLNDEKLRKEEADEKARGVCPKCRIVRAKNGECFC